MQYTLKDRLRASILRSREQVFMRSDFDRFGDVRQVTRALSELEKSRELIRAGYGVYARPTAGLGVDELVGQVRQRLGKRVSRTLSVDGVTVRLGESSASRRNGQTRLDGHKRRIAVEITRQFPISAIRAKGLGNLARWQAQGVWCSAYDEWRALLEQGSDKQILAVMTSAGENANRLRQSPPYTGMLDQETVRGLREKAGS